MSYTQEQVDELISAGTTLLAVKYFLAVINCFWIYDYLITISDEVRYAWPGRKSPVFFLFIANRYWPIFYLVWISISLWSPTFTKSMCDRTQWFSIFYYCLVTVFAQTAITLRVYAVTGKNRRIAAFLSLLTLIKFVFSMYLTVRFGLDTAFEFPDIPLDEFKFCQFHRWRPGETTSTVFSLVYDLAAFLVIVYYSSKRGSERASGMPDLLDRIVRDATAYFLVIFSSHLWLIFFEFLTSEYLQLLPSCANALLVPILATRLMISLKKAATPSGTLWSVYDPDPREGMKFASRTIHGSGRKDTSITLNDFSTRGSVLPAP